MNDNRYLFLQILALIITCSLIYIIVMKVTYDDDENSPNFGNYNKPLAILAAIVSFFVGSLIIIINLEKISSIEWHTEGVEECKDNFTEDDIDYISAHPENSDEQRYIENSVYKNMQKLYPLKNKTILIPPESLNRLGFGAEDKIVAKVNSTNNRTGLFIAKILSVNGVAPDPKYENQYLFDPDSYEYKKI